MCARTRETSGKTQSRMPIVEDSIKNHHCAQPLPTSLHRRVNLIYAQGEEREIREKDKTHTLANARTHTHTHARSSIEVDLLSSQGGRGLTSSCDAHTHTHTHHTQDGERRRRERGRDSALLRLASFSRLTFRINASSPSSSSLTHN